MDGAKGVQGMRTLWQRWLDAILRDLMGDMKGGCGRGR